jgi:hypothetical protein
MKYLKHIKYLFRHKFFVSKECFKCGLIWRGLKHDLSKFLPLELIAYANFFSKNNPRDSTGYYKPTDTGDKDFDFAWFLHQKRNDHHWQWWILPEDGGGVRALEMSRDAKLEMLCDWCGASKAQNRGGWKGVKIWYEKNKNKIVLHNETRKYVERFLGNV